MQHYQTVIDEIYEEVTQTEDWGTSAAYIPELAKVPLRQFGVHLTTVDGLQYSKGDSQIRFSVQSVSKVLSLSIAISVMKNDLWKRVGVEPSGNAFNSIIQLEYENGIPRNPFINSGAIVIADVLVSHFKDPKKEFLEFVRGVSGIEDLQYNEKVAQSEKSVGYMNASLAYMMKAKGNLVNEVEEVLDFYYHQCSLEMNCQELVRTFYNFADTGVAFGYGDYVMTTSQARRINALMMTCGFYDESGEFAFEVGLPGKSGVGGAIVAIDPLRYCVATWSPGLNKKGNSMLGMKALEMLTSKIGTSIF
ncbi:MAG: glutaminase [Reichenbachiella sp.]